MYELGIGLAKDASRAASLYSKDCNEGLGNHLKTGHTLSVQNRPMGLAEDVIVLPCRSVHLQGAIRDVAVMACFQAFLMRVKVVVAPPGSRLAE
jgi:hypothetical protein